MSNEPFGAAIEDFYLSNPIARASAVMAELSAIKRNAAARPAAAE
jgi:NADH-quinone oxidoreductase subunit G